MTKKQADPNRRRRVYRRPEADDAVCQTVSVPQAGQILGISRNAAYAAVIRGELPALRIGKRLVVGKAALEKMTGGE